MDRRALSYLISVAPALRSTSLGLYYGSVGMSAILSGLVSRGFGHRIGAEAMFIFGAAAAILASLALMRMKKIEAIS